MGCSASGCERPTLARGLCGKHYQRWRKHGSVDAVSDRPFGTCLTCIHADRVWADHQLRQGVSHAAVAERLAISRRSVDRHAADHLLLPLRPFGCLTCGHPLRSTLDSELVAGIPHIQVADRAGLSRSAVAKHSKRCLGLQRQGCTACLHPRREAIDVALLRSASCADVAEEFGISSQVAERHGTAHLGRPPSLGLPCMVCEHPDLDAIELCLDRDAVRDAVARAFGVAGSSLRNHHLNHITPEYVANRATRAVALLNAVRRA